MIDRLRFNYSLILLDLAKLCGRVAARILGVIAAFGVLAALTWLTSWPVVGGCLIAAMIVGTVASDQDVRAWYERKVARYTKPAN